MVPSHDEHGCDFDNGWVYVGGRCQRAQLSGAPPELLAMPDFNFGVATSAYQIEGGLDSRGLSVWDTFSHTPGRTANGDTGDVACDHYTRWEEDLELVSALGVDYYRLSIAWPRVMPDGETLSPDGLAFYHAIFDRLALRGIEPLVTLYHWDMPQVLEDRGGWRNKSMIVPVFARYARAMFEEYGGKVKKWATFNEPATFVFIGE
jgi:beta-glucosidase